jgi:hypothetical protein
VSAVGSQARMRAVSAASEGKCRSGSVGIGATRGDSGAMEWALRVREDLARGLGDQHPRRPGVKLRDVLTLEDPLALFCGQ